MTAVRQPAVAGRFYPADAATLRQDMESYITRSPRATLAIGCVVPHAGYMYSGSVAGAVYSNVEIPGRCIILCPNHTGLGQPISIMTTSLWQTPMGAAQIDLPLAEALKRQFPLLTEDAEAHRREHAIEVQLPFLQALRPNIKFVPIALGTANFEILQKLGEALAELLKNQTDSVLMIASSDMNHYENDHITRIKDHKAIERILSLDPLGLFDVVMKEQISMCGFGPTVSMLTAARNLGATSAELVKYATSGDVSGDRDLVVGYAGVIVR